LAAPPGIIVLERTLTTGTGASGEMRLTWPQMNSSENQIAHDHDRGAPEFSQDLLDAEI
jgi:hypothetical protein